MDTVAERPESEEAPASAAPPVEAAAGAPRARGEGEQAFRPAAETEHGAPSQPERKRRGRYTPRRKVCSFCVDHVEVIDYKEPNKLRRYLSDRGKMEPRRKTGTCAKHQRRLTIALKRARHLALLPYTAEHIRLTGAFASRT